jgi:hypothetical protein
MDSGSCVELYIGFIRGRWRYVVLGAGFILCVCGSVIKSLLVYMLETGIA